MGIDRRHSDASDGPTRTYLCVELYGFNEASTTFYLPPSVVLSIVYLHQSFAIELALPFVVSVSCE